MSERLGAAGKLAAAFIDSKLTPLFIAASLALGAMAVIGLPREEEPQIIVPMVDVFVGMPGASPAEVEQRVTRPVEQLLWEVPGVEYVYSTSSPGQAMVIVRFHVGQNEEDALVRLNQKLQANLDRIPPGATPPLVKPRSIDDVPILAFTLWSARYDDHTLRRLATQIDDAIKEVPDVSEVTILGGRPRQMRVDLNPAQLAAYGVDPLQVRQALGATNLQLTTTGPIVDGRTVRLQTGSRLRNVDDVGNVVVTVRAGRPVLVRDVASVRDSDGDPEEYVLFHSKTSGAVPAVTIAMAKRKGTNAITVAHAIERKIDTLRGTVIPSDVELAITRHYGETSSEKSNELLWHMFLAVVSVSALIWIALGRREAVVVLVAIPVTLALTLFLFFLYGYTLNRITLFALIFSIGILVDDAIVVVENVVRHARLQTGEQQPFAAIALRAVDEVGNPTILATLTVVAAILPMAFVGGLMGPYMRPIPIGASAAMIFSLVVAFVVTPWAARRLLVSHSGHHAETEDKLTLWYRKAMQPLITNRKVAYVFLGSVAVLLAAAVALIPLKAVKVKMLPFDNKSEFQVVVDMPEGTPLEETQRVVSALAVETMKDPAVVNVQSYAGTAAPYNFNGLVRHYFLRRAPHLADLQVNLVAKEARSDQSHEIAKRIRTSLAPIAARNGASIQVAEVPPGPPVLQTLVAEIYGPDEQRRTEIASQVKAIFEKTAGVVDTDWYVESPQTRLDLVVDQEKAAAAGVAPAAIAAVVTMASAGDVAGLLHDEEAREDVPIVLRLPRESRSDLGTLASIRINGTAPVAIGEVTRRHEATEARARYHKNLQAVTYVTGDLAGASESPVYAIADMNTLLADLKLPEGYTFDVYNAVQPFDSSKYAMKWDGEWHITIEVFRDLGLAFAVVLLLIYILVVGWFQSFTTPFTIMVAIPFSLVGILPAHAMMGAFFTATSMIGFIAGAGIVVRNSIILVDFIELRVKDGMPLAEAVIDAGAVRFRPMALTAAAVVVGSAVILFDPIFQGLAISLMAGEIASLALSRVAVPVMYYLSCVRGSAAAPALVTPPAC